jgi:hypothetical protein
MSNFQIFEFPRGFSQNSQLILLMYRWKTLISQQFVHCLKIRVIFIYNNLYFGEVVRKILSVYKFWIQAVHFEFSSNNFPQMTVPSYTKY